MNANSGGQTAIEGILPAKKNHSRFSHLLSAFSFSSAGAARSPNRPHSKWFVRIAGAVILTLTASVIASVSLADRAGLSAKAGAANSQPTKLRPLSAREYTTEKAHAWRLYREAKRKCIALGPQPQTACVDQARTERRIRIAEVKAQFESGTSQREIGAVALR